jgi:hypothetical protein
MLNSHGQNVYLAGRDTQTKFRTALLRLPEP